MSRLLTIIFLSLFFSNKAFAFNYLFDLGLSGTSGIGGAILGLLIIYGAFFGTKVYKSVIWGWVLFFVTFGFVFSLFEEPSFVEAMISLALGFGVLMFFIFIGQREVDKNHLSWERKNKYSKKKKKRLKKKILNKKSFGVKLNNYA